MTTSHAASSADAAPRPFSALSLWIDRSIEALWLIAIVAVPLLFLDRDLIWSEAIIAYFEVPKIALLRTLAALIAALWLIQWGLTSRFPFFRTADTSQSASPVALVWIVFRRWLGRRPTNWVVLAVWFYGITTLISTVLSSSFSVSLWGEVPGQDSFATYTVLAHLILFAAIASRLRTMPQLGRLLGAIVVMGVLVSGYAVLQHYGHDFLEALEATGGGRSRVTATTGNAVFAAALMLLSVTTSLVLATVTLSATLESRLSTARNKSWMLWLALIGFWIPVVSVQLLGLIFTFSRGSWIGTLGAFVAFLTLSAIFVGWRSAGQALLVLGISGLLILGVLQPTVIITMFGGSAQFWIFMAASSAALLGGIVLAWRFAEGIGAWLSNLARAVPILQHGTLVKSVAVLGIALALAVVLVGVQSRVNTESGGGDTAAGQVQQRFASISGQVRSGSFSNRGPIWLGSWQLARDHPWFSFDELSLPWLRPVIGYGPDLFRYTYLLVSVPADTSLIPLEPDHAHNYFIHQGVELGLLGFVSSLGLFLAVFAVGAYQLLRHGGDLSTIHKLLLAGLLASLVGRFVEQIVGLSRVSDLTIFWVLMAVFVALPSATSPQPQVVPESPTAPGGTPRPRSRNRSATARSQNIQVVDWRLFIRLAIVAWLLGGIIALTWVKTINYPRAAMAAAESVRLFQQSRDYQGSLAAMDRAIVLGPDVTTYYTAKAAIYAAYLQNERVAPEPECSLELQGVPYDECLIQKNYFSSLAGVEERPLSWRNRLGLANASLALGLDEQAIRLYTELTEMAPASWPLRNRLAEAYITIERPDLALEALEGSLQLTEGYPVPSDAALDLRRSAQQQIQDQGPATTANP
ncbi:MAG: hypothetical protein ACE5Q6_01360 [Dehalococcoidia bacterium]